MGTATKRTFVARAGQVCPHPHLSSRRLYPSAQCCTCSDSLLRKQGECSCGVAVLWPGVYYIHEARARESPKVVCASWVQVCMLRGEHRQSVRPNMVKNTDR